ncbi:J domain-containing protein [Thermodesulfobacterium hveragerdense]|uniref:J domain-containing protein n=1 Tax=Thermodesulfobacterium hveragerdense TaxID=53424 RepID=UPI0004025AB5|nr:J domain-containing protein [Thermodesulfobacterium hveragerdense]
MSRTEKWEKIEEARRILNLPKKTTRREIKEAYHRLVKKHHPDVGGDNSTIKKLNEAYTLLMEYCDNYLINLEPNDNILNPEDWWFEHFGEDPIWGKGR